MWTCLVWAERSTPDNLGCVGRCGGDVEEAISECNQMKSCIFTRYQSSVTNLTWKGVWQNYGESYPNILNVVDLIRTLPASSAENERAFTQMKLVKSDRRSRMKNAALNDLMVIQLSSPPVDQFNPDPAIQAWLAGSSRKRRPGFMDTSESKVKRARLQQLQEEEDMSEKKEEEQTDNLGDEEERIEHEEELEEDVRPKFDGDEDGDGDSDEGFDDDSDLDDYGLTEEEVMNRLNGAFNY